MITKDDESSSVGCQEKKVIVLCLRKESYPHCGI